MAYTSHGHQINGTERDGSKKPATVARCGGPGICGKCSMEATSALRDELAEAILDSGLISYNEEVNRVEHILIRHFRHDELFGEAKETSERFLQLAQFIDRTIQDEAWKTIVLAKLHETQTVAIRAVLEGR